MRPITHMRIPARCHRLYVSSQSNVSTFLTLFLSSPNHLSLWISIVSFHNRFVPLCMHTNPIGPTAVRTSRHPTRYPTSILYTLLAILLFQRMHSLAHARVYLPKRALSSMLFLREARQSQLRLLVLVFGCAHQRRRNRHLARLFPQRRHVRHARLGRLAARTCGVPRLR